MRPTQAQLRARDLAKLRFTLITDRRVARQPLETEVEAILDAGFRAVIVRELDMTARELHRLCRKLRTLTRKHDALLIINDRVDVALAVKADGAHLGHRSLKPSVVREFCGQKLLLGASSHNAYEVREAENQGADYMTLSPVFSSASKPGVEPLGLERFDSLIQASGSPVLALGGITAENAASAMERHACGVALIRGVLGQDDPGEAARAIVAACGPGPE